MNATSSKLRRIKSAMAMAAVSIASSGLAEAANLAINFRGSGYGDFGAAITADAYGVSVADWYDAPESETGTTFLAGLVTVSWVSANDWNQGIPIVPGEGEVNSGYIDDTDNVQTVTLQGISAWLLMNGATDFTLQVIQASDNATGFTNTQVYSSSGGLKLGTLTNSGSNPDNSTFASPTSILESLTSDSLYIDPDLRVAGNRGTIAGIILTTAVPEPSAGLLSGVGVALLGLRRRQRTTLDLSL